MDASRLKQYGDLREVIESLTIEDRDYIFVRHKLSAGEEIKLHYHKEANEWIVIEKGGLGIRIEDETLTCACINQVLVISIPKGQKHSLLALSDISYFVFRDKDDEIIYCDKDGKE